MKKLLLFSIFALLFMNFSQAQTADEIIDNYLKAIGGKEKLSQLKALHIKASTQANGVTIPVDIYMTKDGKQFVMAEFQGQKLVQLAFDGQTAWHTNMMNMKNEKFDKETTDNLKKKSGGDFPNPFVNYKEKGYKIELIGKEEIEGTEAYKIKLTQKPEIKDGKEVANESFYYFDTENFVPIVVETEIKEGQFKGAKVQQVFSDYQEVDGFYFPFSTTTKYNGMTGQEVKFEKVEINPEIDPKLFEFKEETPKK